MKTIKFLFFTLLLFFTSCKALQNPDNKMVFAVAKEISFDILADLFEVEVEEFQKNHIEISGNFNRDKVKKVIGKWLNQELTNEGEIFYKSLKIQTRFDWIVNKQNTNFVYINFSRIKNINYNDD